MVVEVKNIIAIFTVIDGKINVLTRNDKLLTIECEDNFEKINNKYLKDNVNIINLNLKQSYTFSEKVENKLVISVLFSDIVNYNDINLLNKQLKFVSIDSIENNIYVDKSIEILKKEIVVNSTIKKMYPDEFILPEIQKLYESLLNKKYDRRNFRKKLIKLDVIEDLNKFSNNKNGRPAKLYRFKDITEDKILF